MALSRHDFLIKDLAVSIAGASRGGTWLPGPDGETPPSPISPVASVLANLDLIEAIRGVIAEAIETKEFDSIAGAFDARALNGNPVLRHAIHEVGAAVVASAAFAGLSGSVDLPNPNCGGTSYETIPTPITPVVHGALAVHRVSELPRLRRQLAETMKYVEQAADSRHPQRAEVDEVRSHLEQALDDLG